MVEILKRMGFLIAVSRTGRQQEYMFSERLKKPAVLSCSLMKLQPIHSCKMQVVVLGTILFICTGALVNSLPQSRVIGGDIADIKDLPYLIQLHSREHTQGYESRCGASAVSAKWILTAAHCFHGSESNERYAVVDSSTWDSWQSNPEIPIDCTKDCFSHPDYDYQYFTMKNDVGLIIVRGDYTFDARHIVQLPDQSPAVGSLVTVAGWGAGPEGSDQDLLHRIQIPVVDNSVCAQLLLPTIGPEQLCAGYSEEGHNACSGDSGGPLVAKDEASGAFVQYGLVSVGPFCATPLSYVVYANVAAEKSWIESTIQDNSK